MESNTHHQVRIADKPNSRLQSPLSVLDSRIRKIKVKVDTTVEKVVFKLVFHRVDTAINTLFTDPERHKQATLSVNFYYHKHKIIG